MVAADSDSESGGGRSGSNAVDYLTATTGLTGLVAVATHGAAGLIVTNTSTGSSAADQHHPPIIAGHPASLIHCYGPPVSGTVTAPSTQTYHHPYYYQVGEDGTIVAFAPTEMIEDSPPSYEMALLCPSVSMHPHYHHAHSDSSSHSYPHALINPSMQVILPLEGKSGTGSKAEKVEQSSSLEQQQQPSEAREEQEEGAKEESQESVGEEEESSEKATEPSTGNQEEENKPQVHKSK